MKHKNELIITCLVLLVIAIEVFIYFVGDNVDDSLNKADTPLKVAGDYVADGTQYRYSSVDANGNPIYSDVSKPYYLYLEEDSTFSLELPSSVITGKYILDEDRISLVDDNELVLARCAYEEDGLHCDTYASFFEKE